MKYCITKCQSRLQVNTSDRITSKFYSLIIIIILLIIPDAVSVLCSTAADF